MTDDERNTESESDVRIDRRTVLKSAAVASAAGLVGVPAFAGSAAAQETGETLYLTDSGLDVDDGGGTKLFEVDLDDTNGEANLTLLSDLDAESGGNDWYDQVDALAATPDGETIYAIDKFTKRLGKYDVDADTFDDVGVIDGLPNEVVQAAFSPDGTFYVASDSTEKMYVVDPTTPEVTKTIDFASGFGFQGADVVFAADGTLYIFTNQGDSNGAGLYKVENFAAATEPISPTFVGQPDRPYFTGLAVREAGVGNLVGSVHAYDPDTGDNVNTPGEGVSRLFTIDRGDGTKIEEYDTKLGGDDYSIGFGDMTVGVLQGCTTSYDLCAAQDTPVGSVTVTEYLDRIEVTYQTTGGWLLYETHLDVGDEFDDLHTNRPGNPQVGLFDLSETHEGVTEYTYTIECGDDALSDVSSYDDLIIAAHAVVQPVDGCADFSAFEVGESVEGLGIVNPVLDIASTSGVSGAEAVAQKEGEQPATYGAPNGSASEPNGCLDDYHTDPDVSGGFSDIATKDAAAPHAYEFSVADGVTLNAFSLRMLDYGDYNPGRDTHHVVEMVAYDEDGDTVDSQKLEYYTDGQVNPKTAWKTDARDEALYTNLQEQGDACDAVEGEPGNYLWEVEGDGIVSVELTFGGGHDPNIAFTDLCFTANDETAWFCLEEQDEGGVYRFVDRGNWATYVTYESCGIFSCKEE